MGWGSIRQLVMTPQPNRPLTCHRSLLLLLPLLPRAEERPKCQGAQHCLPPLGNLSRDLGRLRQRLCGQRGVCLMCVGQQPGGVSNRRGWLGDCGSATRPQPGRAQDQAPTCSPCICLPPSRCRHSRCTAGQPASGLGAAGNCATGMNGASAGSTSRSAASDGEREPAAAAAATQLGQQAARATCTPPHRLACCSVGGSAPRNACQARRAAAKAPSCSSGGAIGLLNKLDWAVRGSDRELERYCGRTVDPLQGLCFDAGRGSRCVCCVKLKQMNSDQLQKRTSGWGMHFVGWRQAAAAVSECSVGRMQHRRMGVANRGRAWKAWKRCKHPSSTS